MKLDLYLELQPEVLNTRNYTNIC